MILGEMVDAWGADLVKRRGNRYNHAGPLQVWLVYLYAPQ